MRVQSKSNNISNMPQIISEEIIYTIPAEIVEDSNENKVYLGINFSEKTSDENKLYFAEYNGKKYIPDGNDKYGFQIKYDDFFINFNHGYDIDEDWTEDITKSRLEIYKIDKTNITDIVIKAVDVNYLNNDFINKNLIVNNSISMVRNGEVGKFSCALGYNVKASEDYSYAEGQDTISDGLCSHAEGCGCVADASNSHAEGLGTMAYGTNSHAEGNRTLTGNFNSHAEGGSTNMGTELNQNVYNPYRVPDSEVINLWNTKKFTMARGKSSHAEGQDNLSLSDNSHTEGNCNITKGKNSHAEGLGTIASGINQHTQGKYNIEDTANKYAHIVGNGTNNTARSNAHTLDWNGNGWYKGKLSQDGVPAEDKDLTTKKYVDDKFTSMFSFNEAGELVVTINGVSKTFTPKV